MTTHTIALMPGDTARAEELARALWAAMQQDEPWVDDEAWVSL